MTQPVRLTTNVALAAAALVIAFLGIALLALGPDVGGPQMNPSSTINPTLVEVPAA